MIVGLFQNFMRHGMEYLLNVATGFDIRDEESLILRLLHYSLLYAQEVGRNCLFAESLY